MWQKKKRFIATEGIMSVIQIAVMLVVRQIPSMNIHNVWISYWLDVIYVR